MDILTASMISTIRFNIQLTLEILNLMCITHASVIAVQMHWSLYIPSQYLSFHLWK